MEVEVMKSCCELQAEGWVEKYLREEGCQTKGVEDWACEAVHLKMEEGLHREVRENSHRVLGEEDPQRVLGEDLHRE